MLLSRCCHTIDYSAFSGVFSSVFFSRQQGNSFSRLNSLSRRLFFHASTIKQQWCRQGDGPQETERSQSTSGPPTDSWKCNCYLQNKRFKNQMLFFFGYVLCSWGWIVVSLCVCCAIKIWQLCFKNSHELSSWKATYLELGMEVVFSPLGSTNSQTQPQVIKG